MDTIKETLYYIEQYNSLIKYQIKSNKETCAGKRKIHLSLESALPDFNQLKSEVQHNLSRREASPEDFTCSINRLLFLSEANSDLLVEYNPIIRQLYNEYPITKQLEELSFNTYQFIRDEVFKDRDEFERPIVYKGFEDVMTNLPEYYFKDNNYILWRLYHFIPVVTTPYTKQLFRDFNNRKRIVSENETGKLTQQYKAEYISKAIELSTDFCDRNFVSDYLLGKPSIDKRHITGYILSDMLEKLNLSDYARYIEFNYSKYSSTYDWKFEKNSINDYTDLTALPQFEHLILLLSSIFFVRELDKEERSIVETEAEISSEPDTEETERAETIVKEEIAEPATIDKPTENKETENNQLADGRVEVESSGIIYKEKLRPDCITKLSILIQVHEEFNNTLWEDISVLEFLNVFTTTIQKVEVFEIKDKTQFYYLLKRIWKNRTDVSTYRYEKEWLIPFLNVYGLSHSSYSNQFIEKDGVYNHRRFIKAVADIFPE
ncbi:hypothetical protein FACS1894179_08050 [Bacteroidia bacterium]|nr:hypothetical protein FACS1894179_08050 [Bacteroidia bacterium]